MKLPRSATGLCTGALVVGTLIGWPATSSAAGDAPVKSVASSGLADDKASRGESLGLEVVVLGASGGIDEANLTAFLVRDRQRQHYALLDAGSVHAGLRTAWRKGAFDHLRIPKDTAFRPVPFLQREHVRAVLITHPHLDHVAGLAIASPDDKPKPLYALPSTVDDLKASFFNWTLWPNFGSEGPRPLNIYRYQRLRAGTRTPLSQTGLSASAWPLSHDGMTSTGFLLEGGGASLAFLGDTGPDALEKSARLRRLWKELAPHVRSGALKALIIEVSFDNRRPDALLFGHLTPRWLLAELHHFADVVDAKDPSKALSQLKVVVMHIKPRAQKGEPARDLIQRELSLGNDLGVTFVIPRAGDVLVFEPTSSSQ